MDHKEIPISIPPADERITVVLKPQEGSTLNQIRQFVSLGMPVAIGRGIAVIAGASEGDITGDLEPDLIAIIATLQQRLELVEAPFNIDDHVKLVADANRYRWLRNIAFDTPRQDLVPRDRLGNMLIEQDLDGEIDRAMKAYPGEQYLEESAGPVEMCRSGENVQERQP